eukprot:scaffold13149_cov66-Phaeocystis_antarctica.AAC.4
MSACPPTEVSHTMNWNERLPPFSGDAAGARGVDLDAVRPVLRVNTTAVRHRGLQLPCLMCMCCTHHSGTLTRVAHAELKEAASACTVAVAVMLADVIVGFAASVAWIIAERVEPATQHPSDRVEPLSGRSWVNDRKGQDHQRRKFARQDLGFCADPGEPSRLARLLNWDFELGEIVEADSVPAREDVGNAGGCEAHRAFSLHEAAPRRSCALGPAHRAGRT